MRPSLLCLGCGCASPDEPLEWDLTTGEGKSKVINKAILDIGMGPYQWQLFVLCGFGWLADNLILQVSYEQRIALSIRTDTVIRLWHLLYRV